MNELTQPASPEGKRRVIPIHVVPASARQQRQRSVTQVAFFLLFVLAPVFDLFRFDLTTGHAWLLTFPWRLGIDSFSRHEISGVEAGMNILLRLFLPIGLAATALMFIAWRWGRLYCGWLCPHFSAVETINQMMRKASGRLSIWDKHVTPPRRPDGTAFQQSRLWWIPTLAFAVGFAALWAVVILTYLLPPADVYSNLWHFGLTRNQALFLSAATTVLTLEFLFARHLFCRFGCAIGLFQSLAWMSHRGAMVVGYERNRAAECAACYARGGPEHAACEGVCPMRLKPRTEKVKMFTCTQCAQCVDACRTVQKTQGRQSLLRWIEHDEARRNEAPTTLTGKS